MGPDETQIQDDPQLVGELLGPEVAELLSRRQTRAARAVLDDLLEPEVADLLAAIGPHLRPMALLLLPERKAANVFVLLTAEQQQELLDELTNEQSAQLLNEIDPDDRAELFEQMPGPLVTKLLGLMKPEERRRTQVVLGYPEQSVGRLMTPEYLTLRPGWTAERALEHIRRYGHDAETLHMLYVIDEQGRLVDDIRLRDLLLADPARRIETLLDGHVVSLRATDDREEAVRVMERYDLPVLPVVDRGEVLVGIVTFDDVADVAEEEVTEDFHKLGGVAALDQPYLATRPAELVRKRVGWLAILFAAGLLTVTAMGYFEEQLEALPLLAIFVPLIIATGGNSGFQAATVMTRAMALKEVEQRHWARVFARELIGGLMLGGILALMGFVLATGVGLWMYRGEDSALGPAAHIGLAVTLAIMSVVLFGNMIGSMLPFILQRLGADPATSSTPFVATIVDVVGLILYFSIATLVLGI